MTDSKSPSRGYFDEAYRDYYAQNPARKLDHYLRSIRRHPISDRVDLLDVGCGRGLFLSWVAREEPAWSLSGIDPEIEGVEATTNAVPRGVIRLGRAEDIPFGSGSFDVITAWDVLEHLSDVEAALTEIQRCLRPSGLLTLTVPVYDGITGPAIRRLDKDPTHVHKSSRFQWLEQIGSSFDIVDWHGINRILIGGWYAHWQTRRFRRHTAAIMITAINAR